MPVSRRFNDPYFSLADGRREAIHVFLDGNDLPSRFRPGFHIAELGFGTGLNMLVALMAWRQAGLRGPLRYTGFEAYPLDAADIEMALRAFPEVHAVAQPLVAALGAGASQIELDDLTAHLVYGDARETVPAWTGCADAWFLDGFAPARNPELWEPALLCAVARHTRPGGSCATFTAAGAVRRALAAAGFGVSRVPGFARKRHMTVGRLEEPPRQQEV